MKMLDDFIDDVICLASVEVITFFILNGFDMLHVSYVAVVALVYKIIFIVLFKKKWRE